MSSGKIYIPYTLGTNKKEKERIEKHSLGNYLVLRLFRNEKLLKGWKRNWMRERSA